MVIWGVTNEQNLRDFKNGLVRSGGGFLAYDNDGNNIDDTRKVTPCLDGVSRCVREIVQTDQEPS